KPQTQPPCLIGRHMVTGEAARGRTGFAQQLSRRHWLTGNVRPPRRLAFWQSRGGLKAQGQALLRVATRKPRCQPPKNGGTGAPPAGGPGPPSPTSGAKPGRPLEPLKVETDNDEEGPCAIR